MFSFLLIFLINCCCICFTEIFSCCCTYIKRIFPILYCCSDCKNVTRNYFALNQQSSWNVRRTFCFFQRSFSILGPESSISQNIRKLIFGENIINFFRVGFFRKKIQEKLRLGPESASFSPIYCDLNILKVKKYYILIKVEL